MKKLFYQYHFLIVIKLLYFVGSNRNSKTLSNQPGYVSSELIYPLDNKPTPQCHASTIVSIKNELIAAWFGGTAEKNPDVGIWFSKKIKNRMDCARLKLQTEFNPTEQDIHAGIRFCFIRKKDH